MTMTSRQTIWHDHTEEPTKEKYLLGVDADGYAIYYWQDQANSWGELCREMHLKRWCYIDDVEKM